MIIHRYIDRFEQERYTIEVPIPHWAWWLARALGARRCSYEILADQVRTWKQTGKRADYWDETEPPGATR
jgi:hypothetical protein